MQPSQPPDPSASPPPTQVASQPPIQSPVQPPDPSASQPPAQPTQRRRRTSHRRRPKGFREKLKAKLLVLWKWSLKRNVLGGLAGMLVGLAVPWLISLAFGPPADSTVLALMNREAQVAQNPDSSLVASIYSSQAVVMDAACQTPAQSQIWSGLSKIEDRYSNLPPFDSLEHINAHITWVPNNFLATKAYASADTLGALRSPPQALHGHEQWVFAKVEGSWLITLFTYNLCSS